MLEKKDYKDYDKEIIDIDEVEGVDIKINPDYYIHKALLKAQDALTKDNIKEGFLLYRQFIEHIEILCDAANMLSNEYNEEITKFKNNEDYKKAPEDVKSMKLANEKLKLLMKEVFTHKASTTPLKI